MNSPIELFDAPEQPSKSELYAALKLEKAICRAFQNEARMSVAKIGAATDNADALRVSNARVRMLESLLRRAE